MNIPFISTAKAAPKPKLDFGGFGKPVVSRATPKSSALAKKTLPNGTAQSDAVGKAMKSAFKNTKTFGMPGVK